jgi:hypothetical protein
MGAFDCILRERRNQQAANTGMYASFHPSLGSSTWLASHNVYYPGEKRESPLGATYSPRNKANGMGGTQAKDRQMQSDSLGRHGSI